MDAPKTKTKGAKEADEEEEDDELDELEMTPPPAIWECQSNTTPQI